MEAGNRINIEKNLFFDILWPSKNETVSKNVINNNQSEDMKNYGYKIVVDSSIVDITSQFTYTEQRVIDKITWKFGTIRIYARDYYCNGQYVWTECFII